MIVDEAAYLVAIDPIDEFLEHFGVRGMKWGIRNRNESGLLRRAKRGDWKTRSVGQKTGLVVGGFTGMYAGQLFSAKLIQRIATGGNSLIDPKRSAAVLAIGLGSQIVGGAIGARFTRNLLQKNGKKPFGALSRRERRDLSGMPDSLKMPPVTDATMRKLERLERAEDRRNANRR